MKYLVVLSKEFDEMTFEFFNDLEKACNKLSDDSGESSHNILIDIEQQKELVTVKYGGDTEKTANHTHFHAVNNSIIMVSSIWEDIEPLDLEYDEIDASPYLYVSVCPICNIEMVENEDDEDDEDDEEDE